MISLTMKEFALLEVLMAAPGRVFRRDDLIVRAFGHDYEGLPRSVDAHILRLRKKIESDPLEPQLVLTVYGIGYKFTEQ